jgi:hypothetical protein
VPDELELLLDELLELDDELLLLEDELELLLDDELVEDEPPEDELLELDELELLLELLGPTIFPAETARVTLSSRAPSSRLEILSV